LDPKQFLSASRVIIVAGKGGVGKSTVAAALVLAARHLGMTAMLVETDGKPLLIDPDTASGITASTITPADALSEYLDGRGLRRISRRLLSAGIVDVVAQASPGIDNLLVLGKIKQLERSGAADLIVVDGPAAGHAVTMLRTPRAMLDSVKVGPILEQAKDVLEMLNDETRCQVLLVTLPEPTPVNECIETAFSLEDEVGVRLTPVVVNQLDSAPTLDVPSTLDPDSQFVLAAEYRNMRTATHRRSCEDLAKRLPLPQLSLPRTVPPDVEHLAEALLEAIRRLPEMRSAT
jgi:arsenite-transporting ATPase